MPNLHTCPACDFHVRSDVPWAACPNCTRTMRTDPIKGHLGSRPCDPRCQYAKGPQCDCACAGKNHGAGWIDSAGAFAAYTQSKNRTAISKGRGTSSAGQLPLEL